MTVWWLLWDLNIYVPNLFWSRVQKIYSTNPKDSSLFVRKKNFFRVWYFFKFISPTEILVFFYTRTHVFPGLQKKIEQFRSWEWIYGRTPKFKTEFSFNTAQFCSASDIVKVYLEVEHAEIQNIDVDVPPSFLVFITSESMKFVTAPYLKQKFSTNLAVQLEVALVNYFKSKLEDQRLNSVL